MSRASYFLLSIWIACGVQAQQASSAPASRAKPAVLEPGEISDGVYRSAFFGFSYKLPYGFVDRTQQMQEDSGDAAKSRVLLGLFEHPPEVTGSGVNSAVVIAAESAASYPGLNDAAQYFGPLGEVTTAKGLTAVNEPYEFPVDAKPIVRCDFVKKLGAVTMHQSTLALLSKGYVVSFTFIGGSDDEVTMLIENLAFGKVKTPVHK